MRENRPTTFWTDFVESVVELRPSDLTLFWCDKRDINSCGQADYPGAGVCGGIFGLDVCFCHLSNFVYDIRTGKCKPVKPDATVCSIGKNCTVGDACVEPNPVCKLGDICDTEQTTALAVPGSSCTSPKDDLYQCDCPETHQFNPRSCKCIKLDEECAKKKNQCNRIDLFAKCISLEFPDQNNRTYQCLCSFGFTPTKGSCLADLGLWSGSVRLRIWVGGVAVGIVGVIIGVIYIIWNVLRILLPIIGPLLGLGGGNSTNATNATNSTNATMDMMGMNTTRSDFVGSPGIIMGLTACENLSLMRRRMQYDVNVNEAFDRIMYALSCKPRYFEGSEDEFEFE
ncbi:hypothetical protein QYM36_007238 [Artemia franciscana]|nr:hypothetical protein QYM36_007238 [Artemia franciscana]KAK2717025.1 hypothetical protein QYM36_007238 [Artemia franciscana]